MDRLEKAGATFVRGHGRLVGPRTVEVNGEQYEAKRGVVLNPGTAPVAPPIEGLADTPYWTNRDILRIESVPGSLVVIGGGPIGAELAQALARFGVRVTVLEVGDRILGPEEPEAQPARRRRLRARGHPGAHRRHDRARCPTTTADSASALEDQEVDAEKLLVAAGRRPNLADLGLETVGLDPSARSLEVDERMRAGDGLWAIGDVVGKGAFTHVSMYQSAICVRDILGQDGPTADYRALPHVTFTDPEVGSVGMTEKQARDAGLNVRVGADRPGLVDARLDREGARG